MLAWMISGLGFLGALVICLLYYWRQGRQLARERELLSNSTEAPEQLLERSPAAQRLDPAKLSPEQRRELAGELVNLDRRALPKRAALLSLLWSSVVGLGTYNGAQLALSTSRGAVQVLLGGANQTQLIPAEGLTLLAAVTASGIELPQVPPDNSPQFLSLRRGQDLFYLMRSEVLNGAAGEIQLAPGDRVAAIDWNETSLGAQVSTEPGVGFEVDGSVQRPGAFRTLEVSEPIMNAATDEYAGSFDDSVAEVVVVQRPKPGGTIMEHYFIPLTEPDLNLELFQSRIREGDRILYERLTDVELFAPSE